MANDLSALLKMIYPGRGIIGGLAEDLSPYFAYFCGGRSEGSQARRLVLDETTNVIRAEKVTDKDTLRKMFNIAPDDNETLEKLQKKIAGFFPALTEYPAMAVADFKGKKRIVVSNGAQTRLIYDRCSWMFSGEGPSTLLGDAFIHPSHDYDAVGKQWINLCSYETDPPNNTSRINGALDQDRVALSMIKSVKNDAEYIPFGDYLFGSDIDPATGRLLTTYEGGNQTPLLSFDGQPLEVRVEGKTAFDICKSVFEATRRPNPLDGNKCYGAACAVMKLLPDGKIDIARVNYADIVMGRQPGYQAGI